MIDNLISDPMKQIWSWSCIWQVMNFIIFRNFFGFFLNFIEFKIKFSNLKSIDKCASDVAQSGESNRKSHRER